MKSPSATVRNATAITANQAKARAAQLLSATDSTFKSSLSLTDRAEEASHVTNLPLSGRILAEVAVPENMHFRQMELRDAAAVFHLGEQIFNADSFPQLYRTWDAFEVIENPDGDGELCLVAEEVLEGSSSGILPTGEGGPGHLHPHGRIVGFIFGSITEKRKQEHSCGLLGWVGVAPSHQRRNIGTVLAHKLFEAFLEEGISLIVADTPKENTPAIQFLHRMGFATPVYHVSYPSKFARDFVHGLHVCAPCALRRLNASPHQPISGVYELKLSTPPAADSTLAAATREGLASRGEGGEAPAHEHRRSGGRPRPGRAGLRPAPVPESVQNLVSSGTKEGLDKGDRGNTGSLSVQGGEEWHARS